MNTPEQKENDTPPMLNTTTHLTADPVGSLYYAFVIPALIVGGILIVAGILSSLVVVAHRPQTSTRFKVVSAVAVSAVFMTVGTLYMVTQAPSTNTDTPSSLGQHTTTIEQR